MSHRYHSILISAFFCVLIASSLFCAPGGNRLDQFSGYFTGTCPTDLYLGFIVYLLKFTCVENPSAFTEKEFIPVTFLSYTCNYYNRLYLTVSTNFAFRGLLVL